MTRNDLACQDTTSSNSDLERVVTVPFGSRLEMMDFCPKTNFQQIENQMGKCRTPAELMTNHDN